MGWKSVAWMSCLLPVLAGCGAAHRMAQNVTNDVCLSHAQRGIERDLRKEAHAAWATVCCQNANRPFTEEFHDGFLDGFVDYLDRGGDAQPPAVPPMKYVRDKKYFTPQGHCLVRDYYLGFKYGADVAVASGKRQYLTVPVLLPDASCAPGEAPIGPTAPTVPYVPPRKPGSDTLPSPRPIPEPKKSDDPQTPPTATTPRAGKPIPPLPKPEVPVIPPFNPDLSGGKFLSLPVPPDSDLLPVPNPPLPVPGFQLPTPPDEPRNVPSIIEPLPSRGPSSLKVPLSPSLDSSPAVPSILGDIPVMPFRHMPATPPATPGTK